MRIADVVEVFALGEIDLAKLAVDTHLTCGHGGRVEASRLALHVGETGVANGLNQLTALLQRQRRRNRTHDVLARREDIQAVPRSLTA